MLILIIVLQAASGAGGQDVQKHVIYQIVTDRFFNGDRSNDNCPQSAGLFDATHTRWRLYWGGDLAGIEDKLQYLKGMGITAIWISPPVDNINVSIPGPTGRPAAAYHGYWARDFMRIEEHFGDCENSWAAFDRLISAAHRDGIKVIVDFAANHTSDRNAGAFGAVYDNGRFMADFRHDPHGYFHHTPRIQDWSNPYQLQYYTLDSLADLNQENPAIDRYLKSALRQFQQHGADEFRLDAVKHVTWGWLYSLADAAHTFGPSFLFGEWFEKSVADPLYPDSVKFANRSGVSLLDYPLSIAVRDVFSGKAGFTKVDDTIREEDRDFATPNDLVTFLDNQDLPRLLSLKDDDVALDEALAFLLTCRGIPVIYYGDEQYVHDDRNGGNDPYNRPWMSSWSTRTLAYHLIRALARLRTRNDALAYGSFRERWISADAYVYERQFGRDVVLVAMNKSSIRSYTFRNLFTSLPAGSYSDYLGGLLKGGSVRVERNSGSNHPVRAFTLLPGAVAVWQAQDKPGGPRVGSIEPSVGQPGITITLAGQEFGRVPGSVRFGLVSARIISWSSSTVRFSVPKVMEGRYGVVLRNSEGVAAASVPYTVLKSKLVPVTFVVTQVPTSQGRESVFMTGNVAELGQWKTTFESSVGPFLRPNKAVWFICASVPAGAILRFKFFKVSRGDSVVWEKGNDHRYTVPSIGVGTVKARWQTGGSQ